MIPHGPVRDRLGVAWEQYASDYADRGRIERDVEAILAWDGQPDVRSPLPTLFLLWLYMYADQAMVSVDFLTRSIDSLDEKEAVRMFDTATPGQDRRPAPLRFRSPKGSPASFARLVGRSPWRPGCPRSPHERECRPAAATVQDAVHHRVGLPALHEMSDPPRLWTVTPDRATDRRDLPYVRKTTEAFARGERSRS